MDFLPCDQFAVLSVGIGIGDREVDVLVGRIVREGQFDDLLVGNRLASYLARAAIDDDGDGLILTGSLTAVELISFSLWDEGLLLARSDVFNELYVSVSNSTLEFHKLSSSVYD